MEKTDSAKILIVEDSLTQLEALRHLLIEEGYETLLAKDGAEGLEVARRQKPDVVVSDILMPIMDGYEMCRALKSDEDLKRIPVVLLTVLTRAEEVIKGLESGADHFITKPYDENHLRSKLKEVLEKPDRFKNNPARKSIEFEYSGQQYEIHSGRVQTLSYLISTYENTVIQNRKLAEAEMKLTVINEQLEDQVKERMRELRDSEERFRAVAESAADAIICMKEPATAYFWNKRAEEMFGYARDEVLNKSIYTLIVPERYREKAMEGLKKFFESGTGPLIGKTFEIEGLRKDGTEFPLELSISAMKIKGKWHTAGSIRDITEIKRVREAELARLVAETADKAKSDFIANMSHELRTPLTSIIGFSEILREDIGEAVTSEQKGYLNDIWESGRYLLRIINDILDLSKVEVGKMELELSEFDLQELIESSLLLFKEKSIRHSLKLTSEAAEDIGPITADRIKIKQVLLNLVGNAIKFTPEGGSVMVTARRATGETDFVEISVSDTGIGIAKEDIEKLFQPFLRLEAALTKEYEGTGLGLSISRSIIELHGGRIYAESEKGTGSKFTFAIPVRQLNKAEMK